MSLNFQKLNIGEVLTIPYKIIINKYNRIINGVNHGRLVGYHKEDNVYYKIFHPNYCRRKNFINALESGFYDNLTSALYGLIFDNNNKIVGYATYGGKLLSNNEFDFHLIPTSFYEQLQESVKKTKLFYYDFVPKNIIVINDKLSLIDLESIYHIKDLYKISEHNAIVKPNYYMEFLREVYNENCSIH